MYLHARPLLRAVVSAEHVLPQTFATCLWGRYPRQLLTNVNLQRALVVPRTPGSVRALFCRLRLWGRSRTSLASPRANHISATEIDTLSSSGDETSEPAATQPAPLAYRGPLRARIPKGAWDSHMHVLDPARYTLSPQAMYTPSRAYLLSDSQSFHASLGLDKTVFVQPSIYGNDNSCLLDALRTLGPGRAAGVVNFEPGKVPLRTLREWHALGVRAVRVNLASAGRDATGPDLERLLLEYAEDCSQLGWSVQIYLPMPMIELLEPAVPRLAAMGLRVCVDHMGHPSLDEAAVSSAGRGIDPYSMRGFESLVNLLRQGNTFVKLSAPYRFLWRNPEDVDPLEPVARELLKVGGATRVVFATDWPHTRFDGLDITSWVKAVLDWCDGDEVLIDRVFRGNADDLWADRLTTQ